MEVTETEKASLLPPPNPYIEPSTQNTQPNHIIDKQQELPQEAPSLNWYTCIEQKKSLKHPCNDFFTYLMLCPTNTFVLSPGEELYLSAPEQQGSDLAEVHQSVATDLYWMRILGDCLINESNKNTCINECWPAPPLSRDPEKANIKQQVIKKLLSHFRTFTPGHRVILEGKQIGLAHEVGTIRIKALATSILIKLKKTHPQTIESEESTISI